MPDCSLIILQNGRVVARGLSQDSAGVWTSTQDAGSVYSYSIDWTDWLDGATIVDAYTSTSGAVGVRDFAFGDADANFLISTPRASSSVRVTVTASSGRIDSRILNFSGGSTSAETEVTVLTVPVIPAIDWAPSTAYAVRDAVWVDATRVYRARKDHVSGSDFAADLAAGKWALVADFSPLTEQFADDLADLDDAKLDKDGDGSAVTVAGRTLDARARDVVNVKDAPYGAKGDGTTDDRAAILAAVTAGNSAGKTIRLPAGTYRVTGELSPPSGTILIGDGPGKTIIRFDNAASGRLMTLNGVSGVQVRDMTLDGNKAVATTDASIYLTGATSCRFERIHFKDLAGTSGGCLLMIDGASGNVVTDSRFTDAEGTAIGISGETTKNNEVTGNQIQNSGAFGVRLGEKTNGNLVSGNWTTGNTIELIGVATLAYGNRIHYNFATGCGDNGISVSGDRNSVVGNICIGNAKAGIYIWGSHNTVAGNECINNNTEAVISWSGIGISANYGSTGQHNVVVGNIVDDDRTSPTQHGIRLDGTGYTAWASGATIPAGTYVYNGLNIYYAGTGGTTGATAPTVTSGFEYDGGVWWTYMSTFDTGVTTGKNTIANNDVRRYAGGGPYASAYGWGAVGNVLQSATQNYTGPITATGNVQASNHVQVGATTDATYTSVQDVYIKRSGNAGVLIEAGATSIGYLSFGNGSAVNGRLRYENSGNLLVAVAGGVDVAYWGSAVYAPGSDNAVALGSSGRRWTQLSAATGTINTSDARHKLVRGPLNDAERRVAQRLAGAIQVYQWLDAVNDKGVDGARLHAGWIAQEVAAAFAAEGLDASRYAMWCADPEVEEVDEAVEVDVPAVIRSQETVEDIEIRDGVPVLIHRQINRDEPLYDDLAVVDENGDQVMRDGFPMLHRVQRTTKKTIVRKVQAPVLDEAGHPVMRLGLRPDQVVAFILAALAG